MQQAFLQGYLSKEAGLIDWLRTRGRALGRWGGVPKDARPVNFGSHQALTPQTPAQVPTPTTPAKDMFETVQDRQIATQRALNE
jgi:hypothetical protein